MLGDYENQEETEIGSWKPCHCPSMDSGKLPRQAASCMGRGRASVEGVCQVRRVYGDGL